MSTVSTVTLSNNWSYDRMMRLFGGMWFMLLALCVATKLGHRLPILGHRFCRVFALPASTCSWRC